MAQQKRLLVVSRDPAVAAIARALGPATRASGEREALELTRAEAPDAAVVDLDEFPPMLVERLRTVAPDLPAVGVCSAPLAPLLLEFLRCGGNALLTKDELESDALSEALQTTACGSLHFAGASKDLLLAALLTPRQQPPLLALTGRELEIVARLGRGDSNLEIGRRLGISEQVTKNHVARIFRKLGVANRTQAALLARELGLSPDE